jgi:superfamily II DNA helicase RecQ
MSSIYSDMNIADFNEAIQAGAKGVRERIDAEERSYSYNIYREIFDFGPTCSALSWVKKVWRDKLQDIYESEYSGLLRRLEALEKAEKVAQAFRAQLAHIEAKMMPDDSFLNERLGKASAYFLPIMEELREFCSKLGELEVDNKEVAKKVKEALDELLTCLEIACRAIEMIQNGHFSLEEYNKAKTDCLLEERSKTRAKRLKKIVREDDEPGTVNEQLRERLQEWRTARFKKDNIPAFMIMHQSTLMAIAASVPKTKAELLRIKGFGEERYKKYGEEILAITADFS